MNFNFFYFETLIFIANVFENCDAIYVHLYLLSCENIYKEKKNVIVFNLFKMPMCYKILIGEFLVFKIKISFFK